MAIVITGGAGFIGSATAVALLKEGREVIIVDSFEPLLYGRAQKEENLARVRQYGAPTLWELDVRDEAGLSEVLESADIEGVIHLAALAGVRHSIDRPDLYVDVNVTATCRLIRLATERGITRFAIASSSSVYAGNMRTPFAEDDPIVGQVSPYGASKFAMEKLVATLSHLAADSGTPIDVSLLRYFTVYGPGQRPDMAFH